MTDSIEVSNRLSDSITLSAGTSLAVAKQAMAEQAADFLIIDSPTVKTVISAQQLADERSAGACLLSDLPELPPLVSLAADWAALSGEQIENLYQALAVTGAQGILVYQGDEPLGVLSAQALEAGVTRSGVVRVSKGGLDGTSSVSFRIYSCECGSMRIPATGEDVPPTCLKDSSHGPMSLE